MKTKKRYILTIEYIEGQDQCEFIEEKIVDESSEEKPKVIGTLNLEDYFDEVTIAALRSGTFGKT
jgi:hypothetical protein